MKLLPTVAVGILFLASCKKTNEKLLVGSWEVVKVEYAADGVNFEIDEENCVNDDIWTFTKDNTLEINQGLTCAGSTALETMWTLTDDDQTIIYTYEGITGEYYSTIVELTKKSFVEEFETGQVNGSRIRNTFSKL
ncbi:MAG: lipocalin family protein [Putridiphycobacter sp.]|nr:lipocalin family protein [Putridiphycobacter sp.]